MFDGLCVVTFLLVRLYEILVVVRTSFLYDFPNFSILIAPWITKMKTIVPTIKSGLFEFNQFTKNPAAITPKLIITSFDVKIILAFM